MPALLTRLEPDDVLRELRAVPGVGGVSHIVQAEIQYHGEWINVRVFDRGEASLAIRFKVGLILSHRAAAARGTDARAQFSGWWPTIRAALAEALSLLEDRPTEGYSTPRSDHGDSRS